MLGLALARGGQWGVGAWLWLFALLAFYGVVVIVLFAASPGGGGLENPFFGQISASLRRATGFPGWAMASVLSGLWSLLVAFIGLYWDVAWHIDFGRDTQLFTVPHTMILVGLGGLIYSGGLAILFATLDGDEVGLRFGGLRIPRTSLLLIALGVGAVLAFPLDNLWHKAYGIDVTLWSPTHLQLVTGGSLATLALFLMLCEARPKADPTVFGRAIFGLTAGTILVGVSTYQGEFDFGVPQFQLLYLPLLIAGAAAFALVLGRIALGRLGALTVVLHYLILRGFMALAVGGALHHTVPLFPLYIPSALAVEGAFLLVGDDDRLRAALVSGALVGTVGLLLELLWEGLIRQTGWSTSPSLAVKSLLLGPVVAISAAILGAGAARAALTEVRKRMPAAALGLAGVALLAALYYPLHRTSGQVSATIRLQPVGTSALVEVTLDPPNAANGADAFAVTSWQGGGRATHALHRVSPGVYRSSEAVPITGTWKSVIGLIRGDQLMAAPVYLPADPAIGAPAIPALAVRTTPFVVNTKLLLREAHSGPVWPAVAGWSGWAISVAVWVALAAYAASRVETETAAPSPAWTRGAWQPPFAAAGNWPRQA